MTNPPGNRAGSLRLLEGDGEPSPDRPVTPLPGRSVRPRPPVLSVVRPPPPPRSWVDPDPGTGVMYGRPYPFATFGAAGAIVWRFRMRGELHDARFIPGRSGRPRPVVVVRRSVVMTACIRAGGFAPPSATDATGRPRGKRRARKQDPAGHRRCDGVMFIGFVRSDCACFCHRPRIVSGDPKGTVSEKADTGGER